MTKHQKEKQAAKNRAKELGKRVLTLADIEKANADLRRQEKTLNAELERQRQELIEKAENLEQTFLEWTTEYNETVCPALSMQMLLSVLSVASKYMAKNVRDRFFDDINEAMQDGIDKVGMGETNWTKLAIELEEKYGYEVPVWAMAHFEDFDKNNEKERENESRSD